MTYSAPWALSNPQNSSKSGARFNVLPPQELHGRETLGWVVKNREDLGRVEPVLAELLRD